MPHVDAHYPYDPRITDLERKEMKFPESLRGLKDRVVAQFAFEGWLASNPESAKRWSENPEHWSER
jgi:hypothetical protein